MEGVVFDDVCIVKVGSWNVASLGGPDNSKRNILWSFSMSDLIDMYGDYW